MCRTEEEDEKYSYPDIPGHRLTWSVPGGAGAASPTYGDFHSMIHRDISIGNDYRKERIKHLTTLATAVFAFTVTFHKDIFDQNLTAFGVGAMGVGWVLLLVSLGAGVAHLRQWEDFYLEHRELGNAIWRRLNAGDNSAEVRKSTIQFNKAKQKTDTLRDGYRRWNIVQTWSLLGGMAAFAIYVAVSASDALMSQKPEASTSVDDTIGTITKQEHEAGG